MHNLINRGAENKTENWEIREDKLKFSHYFRILRSFNYFILKCFNVSLFLSYNSLF